MLYSQDINFQKIEAYSAYKNYKISEITQDNAHIIWLATNKGLLKFDGISIAPVDFKTGKPPQRVQTLLANNDSLFIGGTKSLVLKTFNNLLTFDANSVNKIYKHQNTYFIGSNQGLLHFNNNLLGPLKTAHNLDFSIINDIIYHEKKFIVAANSGLWIVHNPHQPKKAVLISSGNYTSLLQLKKKLYVVKNKTKIEALTTENKLIQKYVRPEIQSISAVNNKVYVASKNEGIDVLNSASFRFEKRISKYNSSLKSNALSALFEDAEKNIFIATASELYIQRKSTSFEKPFLKIVNLEVNYKRVDSINVNANTAMLHLNSNQNNLSFLLESTSISTPKNIEFRYKLNQNFSLWNASRHINFASLNPGKYEFIVQARFKDGAELSTKKFSFFIAIPFYKKAWFLVLCSFIFFLLLAVIIEFYLRKLKVKSQQKIVALKLENHLLSLEQKALQLQMNPHFIFNVLNGIKALGISNKKEELNEAILEFSILLRSVLNNSRLEEISLKEEIETLQNYVRLEQKMGSKKFEFSLEKKLAKIDPEELLIPPMLLQPFIENALKHGFFKMAHSGKISVVFKIKNQFLECTVEDNGIGIFQSQKENKIKNHHSVALKITKERIENLSKTDSFSMEEIKKENIILGTRIWFKIPLKTDY